MRRGLSCVVVAVLLAAVTACSGDDAAPPPSSNPLTTTPGPTTTRSEPPPEEVGLRWWNDRVFYEVFVRSFKDADGDGIGDLAGLTASLDYLNDGDPTTDDDLGVTGIWLMPIFPSPSYHGYDVTDYRSVNPDYGTMADFEAFLDAAHERGIAVLIDLVVNHTSREHPWFVASAAGNPEYADWYRWSDTNPGTQSPWAGGPVWHASGDRYYFGLFWEGMPDLNLANPEVTAEVHDIARFWLEDVGVDGFRLDAARHLVEEGEVLSDTPSTVAWLEEFNAFVDSVAADALVLGEVWSPTAAVARYVPDALDLAFEFDLAAAGGEAVASEDAGIFERALAEVQSSYPELQYATFLTNHDMDRIMSAVSGDVRVATLAATWLLTGPGVPFLYYGEEVGLQGTKPDERIRTPMPWTADEPGVGFTTGTPWEAADPGFAAANVAAQTADPASLLSHYRSLVHARSDHPALRRGDLLPVETGSSTLTAFVRSEGDDHVLVVLNLGRETATSISLDLPAGPLAGIRGAVPLAGPAAAAPDVTASGGFAAYQPVGSLDPYGFLVLHLTPEPSAPPPPPPPTTSTTVAPERLADAALVERLLADAAAGDLDPLVATVSPDAVLVVEDGTRVRLSEPVPPESGFLWDWDADGTVTVGDLVLAQNEFGAAISTGAQVSCEPAGNEVVCVVTQSDAFADAAGLAATVLRQTFRLVDGLIIELRGGEPDWTAEEQQAWLEQFAAYEQWVAATGADQYATAFSGPCCTGTPEGVRYTSEAVALHRGLVAEWAAQR